MEEEQKRSPGLRFDGNGRPMWRASKAAVKAGYPVKTVNLSSMAGDARLLRDRCMKLQREMLEWISNGDRRGPQFDGTFASLLDVYQSDPESSYFELKPGSLHPYNVYLPMLRAEIGHCHIDRTDGVDVKRWFKFWAAPVAPKVKRTVAKARMCVAVIRAAVKHGVIRRLPGCAEFASILDTMEFEAVPAREQVLEAAQVIAARQAAHALGEPRVALCYAIQYEGTVRQWDVRGQWFDLSDPRPSAVISHGKKWFGATWSNVDENLILRLSPTKTEDTSAAEIVVDFRVCPMIMEELALIPEAERHGPLITRTRTGLPFFERAFLDVWRKARKKAGIPVDVWNRDLRASGTTEARAAAAPIDDVKKLMGHSERSKVTAKVYDRAKLEAHRRIAQAREAHREKKT